MVHVKELILISMKLVYFKNVENKKNHLSIHLMTEIERNGQNSGQATLTNKINSARDKSNFDAIAFAHMKDWRKRRKNKKNQFSALLVDDTRLLHFAS